jgi:phosphoribosylformylglycinamidine synthase II
MSRQSANPSLPIFRIAVSSSLQFRARGILSQLPAIGISKKIDLHIIDLYFVEGNLAIPAIQELIESLICDPVTDRYEFYNLVGDKVAALKGDPKDGNPQVIEVTLRAGVTDNVANELLHAAHRLGIDGLQAVTTGKRYELTGNLPESSLNQIARALLVNNTIQRYSLGEIQPEFIHSGDEITAPETFSLEGLNDDKLLALSAQRRLALDVNEMRAVQAYFTEINRPATDAELEAIAQTWSEHCVHKTFKAQIEVAEYETGNKNVKLKTYSVDGLLKTYLRSATEKINAPWVCSSFVDNAGVIEFDQENDLSFKVETHNHPSAIEPFGGANTGTGGVVRDVLGVSHRPIAATDVLCFGPTDLHSKDLLPGVLHPARIQAGVVAGIGDYGNKLGLPTVNGAVYYHPGYTANPLVYCGCVGIGPHNSHPREAKPGDRVIVIGGRTGRDGLRGATFSSLTMDAQTGEVAGASVQIGDPITEKGLLEVVERARDLNLYNAITDCGAGGLSSAVGEMAKQIGANIDISKVPLKYAGLAPWEIWLSEAQERMVLAVPPKNVQSLIEICKTYWVEWSDIGEFQRTGKLVVIHGDIPILELDNQFLHHGIPRHHLEAVINDQSPVIGSIDHHPSLITDHRSLLIALLAHPDIASKEDIIRVYDHQVRGSTVVAPLVGTCADGPSDAAVLKPLEIQGWRGFVLANGLNPYIGEVDAYSMAVSAIDEAIRNAVAVGADPDRLALLDNFCWGDPCRPEILGSLVRAAQGCYDAALHYGTPFISGKDSLNNEYLAADGKRRAIPGTLLISSIALHPDIRDAITMDLKAPGNHIYLVGEWNPALKGSHARHLAGEAFFGDSPALQVVPILPTHAPEIYRTLHQAIRDGLVRAAHDLSEGGLAVTAAEMALAGRLGIKLDLTGLSCQAKVALFAETNGCLLVEVTPADKATFESRFKDLPCIHLGTVYEEPTLQIRHVGTEVVNIPIEECLHAFRSRSVTAQAT